ncbi:glycosyltransferase family 2 protein [Salinarchaeum laminariae]|uniref:glycosyltransferase family 2 protein n=1 Tax=Salinarchaeum laminariae TaxID=869888 RepID=UPI0020BF30AE|nr:glycosyltransferase family 2 protein [Salinarchaeum laminariae]
MAPLVSVLLPAYEELEFLEQAVDSILRQSHDRIEVIVVHSGDPAGFPERVRASPAVTYEHQEPRGVAAARNRALDLASGSVIAFCDADDYWHPAKLSAQLPVLDGDVDLVYSDEYLLRGGNAYQIDSPPIRDPDRHHVDVFRNGGGVGSRSVIARAACFEDERFDERFEVREDQHLWTRLFASFTPARVARPLSYKRETAGSLSSDVDRAYRLERLEIEDLCQRFPELRPYREERERQMRYRYAKRLLANGGRATEARGVLRGLVADGAADERILTLLLLSALPIDHESTTRRLQDLLWTLQSYRRKLRDEERRGPDPWIADGERAD